MTHRDFELPVSDSEAPTFSVAGHEFKCLPDPPSGVLLELVGVVGQDVAVQARGIIAFLEGCLTEADVEQFRTVIHAKDIVIPLATLGSIAEWLAEVYAGRPTTPSSASVVGLPTTPAMSVDGSDSPVQTPAP